MSRTTAPATRSMGGSTERSTNGLFISKRSRRRPTTRAFSASTYIRTSGSSGTGSDRILRKAGACRAVGTGGQDGTMDQPIMLRWRLNGMRLRNLAVTAAVLLGAAGIPDAYAQQGAPSAPE